MNALFLRPCRQSFGAQCVGEYLVSLAESNNPSRVIGAFDAFYWVVGEPPANLFARRKIFLLEACVAEIRPYARKRILSLLTEFGRIRIHERLYPETHSELVARAQGLYDEMISRTNDVEDAVKPSEGS